MRSLCLSVYLSLLHLSPLRLFTSSLSISFTHSLARSLARSVTASVSLELCFAYCVPKGVAGGEFCRLSLSLYLVLPGLVRAHSRTRRRSSPPRFRRVASRHNLSEVPRTTRFDVRRRFRCVAEAVSTSSPPSSSSSCFFFSLCASTPHTIAVIPPEYRTASSSLIVPPIVSDHRHTASLRRRSPSSSILVDLSLLHFVHFTPNARSLAGSLSSIRPASPLGRVAHHQQRDSRRQPYR